MKEQYERLEEAKVEILVLNLKYLYYHRTYTRHTGVIPIPGKPVSYGSIPGTQVSYLYLVYQCRMALYQAHRCHTYTWYTSVV